MKKKQTTQSLVSELAKELGYETSTIDTNNSGSVVQICKGKKCCLMDGGSYGYYPTNLRWQSALFKDKITLQKYLKRHGIKTIPSKFFRIFDFSSSAELIRSVEKEITSYNFILKPAMGHDGSDIKIIESKTAMNAALKTFFKNRTDFMVQKILELNEIRIFIQRGEIIVLHSKNHKYIRSDGIRKISDQLQRIPEHKKSDVFIRRSLKKNKLTLNSIPEKGTKIYYHLVKDNTRDHIETKNFNAAVKKWAKNISDVLNANVIGVDIFISKGIHNPSGFTVIEVNANPSFRDYAQTYKNKDLSKEILKNELTTYFKL